MKHFDLTKILLSPLLAIQRSLAQRRQYGGRWTRLPLVLRGFLGAMLAVALMIPAIAFSQYSNPEAVPLFRAGTFGALAYSGITTAGTYTVNGDGGTSTATIATGITFTGMKYDVGAQSVLDAQTDLAAALTNANGRTNNATITGDALGGLTLGRGVYGGGALDLASGTTLTLDALGDANAVFIIKAACLHSQ